MQIQLKYSDANTLRNNIMLFKYFQFLTSVMVLRSSLTQRNAGCVWC